MFQEQQEVSKNVSSVIHLRPFLLRLIVKLWMNSSSLLHVTFDRLNLSIRHTLGFNAYSNSPKLSFIKCPVSRVFLRIAGLFLSLHIQAYISL